MSIILIMFGFGGYTLACRLEQLREKAAKDSETALEMAKSTSANNKENDGNTQSFHSKIISKVMKDKDDGPPKGKSKGIASKAK